ncbi:MAG: acyltransferase family protein [Rhodanobacter sp.]
MRYNPSLDGVRAIAVGMVVAFHAKVAWMPGGYLGVDIFFVLSGYLITSLLLSELQRYGKIDLVGFYARRLIRLGPALLLLLLVYVGSAPWLFPGTPFSAIARDSVASLMYFSDYTQALFKYPDVLLHTWSLSVEEHFYLLWPLLLLVFSRRPGEGRRRSGAFMVLALVLFMLATNWRMLASSFDQSWTSLYYRFDTHASGILLGCLLGTILSGRLPDGERNTSGLAVGGLAVGLMQLMLLLGLVAMAWKLPWTAWGYPRGYLTGIELTSAFLICSLAIWPQSWLAAVLSWMPIRYLGQISYGIYLWNFPVVYFLHMKDHDMSPERMLLLSAAINVLLASVSYFSVERLARRLKPRTYSTGRHMASPMSE